MNNLPPSHDDSAILQRQLHRVIPPPPALAVPRPGLQHRKLLPKVAVDEGQEREHGQQDIGNERRHHRREGRRQSVPQTGQIKKNCSSTYVREGAKRRPRTNGLISEQSKRRRRLTSTPPPPRGRCPAARSRRSRARSGARASGPGASAASSCRPSPVVASRRLYIGNSYKRYVL